MHGFLLVFYSNFVPKTHRFWEICGKYAHIVGICGKSMRYAHLAKICGPEECIKLPPSPKGTVTLWQLQTSLAIILLWPNMNCRNRNCRNRECRNRNLYPQPLGSADTDVPSRTRLHVTPESLKISFKTVQTAGVDGQFIKTVPRIYDSFRKEVRM